MKQKPKSVWKSHHLPEATFQSILRMSESYTEKRKVDDGSWRGHMVWKEGQAWTEYGAQCISLTINN